MGQRAHLGGDDGEATSLLPGTRCFHRGIQRHSVSRSGSSTRLDSSPTLSIILTTLALTGPKTVRPCSPTPFLALAVAAHCDWMASTCLSYASGSPSFCRNATRSPRDWSTFLRDCA